MNTIAETIADEEETPLISEAQNAGIAAFRRLMCDYDKTILGLAMRITASDREARHLYRETMQSIRDNLGDFRFECPFYIWVYLYVTAVSLKYLQRRRPVNTGGIDGALETLTPRERITIELKHYHRERLEDIGEMLGITEEAARNALVSGIQKLHTRLNEHHSVNSL